MRRITLVPFRHHRPSRPGLQDREIRARPLRALPLTPRAILVVAPLEPSLAGPGPVSRDGLTPRDPLRLSSRQNRPLDTSIHATSETTRRRISANVGSGSSSHLAFSESIATTRACSRTLNVCAIKTHVRWWFNPRHRRASK